MPAFPDAEYAQRLAKTRTEMQRRSLDALLVTDPANMYYLTGYDAWSFYVPQAVIVPLAEEPPIWVGRGMDAPSAVITTRLPPERILTYADDYVESPTKHPMQHIAKVLAENGWQKSGTPRWSWADAPFRPDSATCVESSGCRQRYLCRMSRTVSLGPPPDEIKRLAEVVREGMSDALAAVGPDRQCQEVEAAWRQT